MSTASAKPAPSLEALDAYLHELEDRHLHNKKPTEDDAFKWNQVIRIVGSLEAQSAAERTTQRDAALEVRTRIIDILDECDRTVYAQQKWKVANAGLQGWLFKVEAENPEILSEIDAQERAGAKA